MKLKEIYEKVNQYNEAIDALQLRQKHLKVTLWWNDWSKYEANSYDEIIDVIKTEYIESFANELINADFNEAFNYYSKNYIGASEKYSIEIVGGDIL